MRRFAAITLALTLGVAGTAHAAAGDDARLAFVQTGFVSSPTVAEAPVPCPAGEAALGGGIRRFGGGTPPVQESGPQSTAGGLLTNGQRPGRWFSSVYNDSGASMDFATYAVCSASSDATVQTTTLGVTFQGAGMGYQGSATMPCPDGQRAVGGGILGQGRLESSGPVDETLAPANTADGDIPRGWFVSMVTDSNMPPTYRMYALCSPTSTATIQVESRIIPQPGSAAFGVGCPSNQRLLSGGVHGNIPRGEIIGSGPAQNNGLAYTSTDSNNMPTTGLGWRVEARNIGAQAEYLVTAVCEAPSPTTPTDPTDPTDPTNPTNPPPSNQFSIGKLVRNRDRGTGQLPLTLPGPGVVELSSRKLKPQAVQTAGGDVLVKVKSIGDARRKLRRKGKLRFRAALTFTPSGGTANTLTAQAKLKRD